MMHARAFLVVCLALCFSCSSVSAQTINEVLAHKWRAVDTIASSGNEGSQMIVEQLIDSMIVDSTNKFAASGKTIVTVGGKRYITRYPITGEIRIMLKKKMVSITYDEQANSVLISGHTFCAVKGQLQLYRDSDRQRKYFLEGNLESKCGFGQSFTRFFD
jgi:hypothetical protein